jgi:hypothetical protein
MKKKEVVDGGVRERERERERERFCKLLTFLYIAKYITGVSFEKEKENPRNHTYLNVFKKITSFFCRR